MNKLNLDNLSRPEAFQTGISKLVRKTVLEHVHEVEEPILDACCGNGIFLLEYCSSVNYYSNIYGVDLDIDALETAEQLFIDNNLEPPSFAMEDVSNLSFPDNKFSSIFCLNTLINIHPFSKIEGIITELFRILKPGGKIYIDFRNKLNPILKYKYRKNIKDQLLTTYGHKKTDFYDILKKLAVTNYSFRAIGIPFPYLAKGYLLIVEKPL